MLHLSTSSISEQPPAKRVRKQPQAYQPSHKDEHSPQLNKNGLPGKTVMPDHSEKKAANLKNWQKTSWQLQNSGLEPSGSALQHT